MKRPTNVTNNHNMIPYLAEREERQTETERQTTSSDKVGTVLWKADVARYRKCERESGKSE